MVDADYIIENTGYAPGGVPPFGHLKPCILLMDEDLFQYDLIWGAAGSADSVFQLLPMNYANLLMRLSEISNNR